MNEVEQLQDELLFRMTGLSRSHPVRGFTYETFERHVVKMNIQDQPVSDVTVYRLLDKTGFEGPKFPLKEFVAYLHGFVDGTLELGE